MWFNVTAHKQIIHDEKLLFFLYFLVANSPNFTFNFLAGHMHLRVAYIFFFLDVIDSLCFVQIKIEELVTAMGGILHSKASLDVSFVIVKSVVAAKFKVRIWQSFVIFLFFCFCFAVG